MEKIEINFFESSSGHFFEYNYEILFRRYFNENKGSETDFIIFKIKEFESKIKEFESINEEILKKYIIHKFSNLFKKEDIEKLTPKAEKWLKEKITFYNQKVKSSIDNCQDIIKGLEFRKQRIENNAIIKTETNTLLDIDLSNSKATEKIIYLNELGIIDLLRTKRPFNTSVNSLAVVLSAITGEKTNTLQPYLNAMLNNTSAEKNNPYNSKSTTERVKSQLINVGFQGD